jgi:peptidoglycan/xylan/chitin deacetylase (PgdA/CDA1 family)
MAGIVYLMYHELKCEGRELCESSVSYRRYAVAKQNLRKQLSLLQNIGYSGLNVSQACDWTTPDSAVVFTFDDGCETDLLAATPLLREFGFNATFYVVAGFIGQRRGYLSATQLREMADAGFEVGCHSRTHPNLSQLDSAGLHDEIVVAKDEIEQMLGRSVKHFSCPGGFWSPEAARIAAEAGFKTVATSRIGMNSPQTDRFRLARVAIYHGASLVHFERVCRGTGLFVAKNKQLLLDEAKNLLGESSYRRMRATLLGTKIQ